ncbi:molybdopterin oxidoreductase family protein [Paenibacillus macerans]|uniref:Molybdopterin-dependent oxidoreductase n=2 Tax=Paenibacillus macerans TaxID=44252 RepID=A0A6N8EZQ4_PAEMA|nr:molybdopterin oxidoreductase family protein [Paenibacillus macerans]MBS5913226.1 molybdopterin oxidoreductase family protein [Paenibacillus macerans]MDU5945567.1 molybdopterin oxidoreductase family protein [Paenibacillus macerans]MEC0136634.1 molybdopterin oxidoreductase family protein [Paenibacillus macerans]MEC0330565.1 molybdopterin oxidoreductase family protein [Paenibacillus macerans]MUG25677.1 molybdopterin-dependent oxidoreductase [Paenibacillus macerans]
MIHEENGVFPAVCPLDCPDTCGLLLHKENGKIVKVTGNPDHPVTQGAICNKVRNMAERVYHPERVLYPLKRVGAKGEGKFARITWDEAVAEISGRYKELIREHGPESIMPYSFYGNMGILSVDGMDRRFFHRLGTTQLQQGICNSAGNAGWKYTMGFGGGTSPEETVNAKLIIVWGGNLVSTNMHQVALIEKARKQGAQLVVIDVHRNRTGQRADWFIPLYPGTDSALALGIMHVLFERGLVNETFLERYTIGHAELREHVKQYTPERVSAITGVPAEDIVKLAVLYGETSPAYIHIGNGLQHHDNGGMNVRTISCLPALTGQWLVPGGGAYKSNGAYGKMNAAALERPDLRPNPGARTVSMNRLGEALLTLDPPIRALFVYCSNPAVVAPDTGKVERGLRREDLFTVVHDLFLTDTAKYADIVLPATSSFENTDLYSSYWHHYVQLQEPVIPARGESKSNVETFKLLAAAMGFEEEAFRDSEEDMIRQALQFPHNPYLQGVTLEKLQEQRFVKLNMEHQKDYLDNLKTPSGKIELYSAAMERAGLPPLPTYVPLREGYDGERRPGEGDAYPLMFISPPNHSFLNSTFGNVEKLTALEKSPLLQIHPQDAAERGIEDGDEVTVWNDRGSYRVKTSVTDKMLPGIVVSQGLWWEQEDGRRTRANALTPDRLADLGGGAVFFSTVVNVKRQ